MTRGRGPYEQFPAWRRLAVCLAVVVAVVVGCSDEDEPFAPVTGTIDWHRCDVDSFLGAPGNLRGHIFVVVTASWCGACNYFVDSALADPAVVAIVARHYVPVLVDLHPADSTSGCRADSIPEILGNVRGIPAAFIIRNGAVESRILGYRSPAAMQEWLLRGLLGSAPSIVR
jgi:hypothetical protein